ncbi:unnamed protein product [Umbelopsis ramanniana]
MVFFNYSYTLVLAGLMLAVVQAQNGDGSGGVFDPCYTDADCLRDLTCLGGYCQ